MSEHFKKIKLSDLDTPEVDSSLNLPRGYISVSQVSQYYMCGWRYYHTYVLGKRGGGSVATATGRSVHKIIEDTLRVKQETNTLRELEEALDEASTIVSADFSELDSLEDPDTGEQKPVGHWLDKVRAAYKLWHKIRAPEIVPLAVEKSFEVPVKGVLTRGVIDLIDGANGVEVIDTKVTKRKKPDRDAENSLQLALYANVEGCASVGYDNIIKGKVPRFNKVRTTLTPQQVTWSGELIRDAAESISAGVFPKTSPDNWWCSERFCQHWSECRGKKI
jgi:CRISPR/Cas system-associated exonuclease Cas4 (RecB family)